MHFDENGPWDLEIEGFEVTQIGEWPDPLDIIARRPEGPQATIRLEGIFKFHERDGSVRAINPDQSAAALLEVLRGDTIRLVRITKTSKLRVEFASGHAITSSADANYENWEVHAPGKFTDVMVIAVPGGGEPAIWDGETRPRRHIADKAVETTDS